MRWSPPHAARDPLAATHEWYALIEFAQFVDGIRVVEAEHGLGVRDRREAGGGTSTHPLRGRIGGDEVGMRGLEGGEFPHERVEFDVRDLGVVQDVVTLFVMTDQIAQLRDAIGGGHRSRETT